MYKPQGKKGLFDEEFIRKENKQLKRLKITYW